MPTALYLLFELSSKHGNLFSKKKTKISIDLSVGNGMCRGTNKVVPYKLRKKPAL